jgi:hypothetical protein
MKIITLVGVLVLLALTFTLFGSWIVLQIVNRFRRGRV